MRTTWVPLPRTRDHFCAPVRTAPPFNVPLQRYPWTSGNGSITMGSVTIFRRICRARTGFPRRISFQAARAGSRSRTARCHVELPQAPPCLYGCDLAIESLEFCLQDLDLLQDRPGRLPVGHGFDQPGDLPLGLGPPLPEGLDVPRVLGQRPPDGFGGLVQDIPEGHRIQDCLLHAVQEGGVELVHRGVDLVAADRVPPFDVVGAAVPVDLGR